MNGLDFDTDEAQPRSQGPYRVPATGDAEAAPSSGPRTDPAMTFATITLLVASLVRLVPPLSGHEPFGVEATLALGAALVCSWLALREAILQVRARVAARRAAATVRSTTTE